MPLPITHIFEVVDSTDEEHYISMGFYIDEKAAIETLDVAEPPRMDDWGEDLAEFEVRKHELGWNRQTWQVIAKRRWDRQWPEQEGDPKWLAREVEQLPGTDGDASRKPDSQPPPEHRCRHGILWGHCPDCPTAEDIAREEAAQAARRPGTTGGTY